MVVGARCCRRRPRPRRGADLGARAASEARIDRAVQDARVRERRRRAEAARVERARVVDAVHVQDRDRRGGREVPRHVRARDWRDRRDVRRGVRRQAMAIISTFDVAGRVDARAVEQRTSRARSARRRRRRRARRRRRVPRRRSRPRARSAARSRRAARDRPESSMSMSRRAPIRRSGFGSSAFSTVERLPEDGDVARARKLQESLGETPLERPRRCGRCARSARSTDPETSSCSTPPEYRLTSTGPDPSLATATRSMRPLGARQGPRLAVRARVDRDVAADQREALEGSRQRGP